MIGQYLRRNNINYSTQYTFQNLISEKGYPLKFDFAIFKDNQLNCLIEFDGRQHTLGPEADWAKADSLATIQMRDKLKDEYCKNNNIKLIRISYLEKDKINDILDTELK